MGGFLLLLISTIRLKNIKINSLQNQWFKYFYTVLSIFVLYRI
nr:MAG TPA: hypothetical protein [Caudoviricetes sp.]